MRRTKKVKMAYFGEPPTMLPKASFNTETPKMKKNEPYAKTSKKHTNS